MAHSRSMSQPSSFFANNCLPPLSPFPPTSESSLASSTSNFKDLTMEETDVSSRKAPSFTFRGNEGLPPVRGHRRSNSDVPLGFSAMIQSSPQLVPISGQGVSEGMRETGRKINKLGGDTSSEGEVVNDLFNSFLNMENANALNCSGNKDKESTVTCINREGVKRSATGDIGPPARHYRSLSMDSGIGNFQLENVSPKMQNQVDHFLPGNSGSDNSGKPNLDFGHGEFNEFEMKKIMGDERLAEIAISDPKRAKRILANRQSAARSKERKLRYISELEHKVQMLQTEATTLSAQFTSLQKDYAELMNENNELKFRFQAMEQQAKLRDALHEALNGEVQRLKLANMELREDGIPQQVPMKLHMFPVQQQQQQQQPNQMQPFSVSRSSTSSTS